MKLRVNCYLHASGRAVIAIIMAHDFLWCTDFYTTPQNSDKCCGILWCHRNGVELQKSAVFGIIWCSVTDAAVHCSQHISHQWMTRSSSHFCSGSLVAAASQSLPCPQPELVPVPLARLKWLSIVYTTLQYSIVFTVSAALGLSLSI